MASNRKSAQRSKTSKILQRLTISTLSQIAVLPIICCGLLVALNLKYFERDIVEALLLSVLSFVSGASMVFLVRRRNDQSIALLTFLSVFSVAYYLGLFRIVANPEWILLAPIPVVATVDGVMAVFRLITYCFTASVASYSIVPILRVRPRYCFVEATNLIGKNFGFLLVFVLSLIVVTSLVMMKTGIAVMGGESVELPFRLAGIIFYTRAIVIPGILLVLITTADTKKEKVSMVLVCLVYVVFSFTDTILRASRGSLIYGIMNVGLLCLSTGRLYWSRVYMALTVVLVSGLVWPVVTEYRALRTRSLYAGIDLKGIEDTGKLAGTVNINPVEGINMVVDRITGSNSLLATATSRADLEYELFLDGSVTRFYTNRVLGFPVRNIHSSSPSMIGWLYIAGGACSAVVGVSIILILCLAVEKYIIESRLRARHVIRVLCCVEMIRLLTGGVFEALPERVLTIIAVAIICETIMRSDMFSNKPYILRANG